MGGADQRRDPELGHNMLRDAYFRMRTIREFEERVRIEFEKGNIPGFIHLYVGQEASAVGVCMNLADSDYVGSTHRGHGHCIAKGCDVNAMTAEIFGRRTGLCGGKGGSMHVADFERGMLGANAIVGGNPPMVIGAALSAKTLETRGVAVSFTGDGGSNQGTTLEAMNMAVVLKLPAIFVFENNGFGEMTSADYAVGCKDIAARAAGFGMPAVTVDGSDFFAVHAAAKEAIDRARAGDGPSTVEVFAPRWHGHFAGDAQLYRAQEDKKRVRENDPLENFKKRVLSEGSMDGLEFDRIDADVGALIESAFAAASAAPEPLAEDLLTDVYASY